MRPPSERHIIRPTLAGALRRTLPGGGVVCFSCCSQIFSHARDTVIMYASDASERQTQTQTHRETQTHTDKKQKVQSVSANHEQRVAARDSLTLAKRVGTNRSGSQTLEHVAGWQPRRASTYGFPVRTVLASHGAKCCASFLRSRLRWNY